MGRVPVQFFKQVLNEELLSQGEALEIDAIIMLTALLQIDYALIKSSCQPIL